MLEVNEENIRNLVRVRELDMKSIDKWVSLNGNGYDIIIPTELDEYKQFIIDWLPLCPNGTEAVIKDVEKKMKKIAKKNGYLLEEKHVLLMKAREIARIKREYANEHDSLVKRADKKFGTSGRGFSYLFEVVDIMQTFLNETEKDFPKAISIYEGKTIRRRV